MSPGPQVATFPARMDAFPGVAAFIERWCVDAAIARDEILRVTLVVEELFTNTVMHGHGGDSDAPVSLGLDFGPGGVEIAYEDTAPEFDPRTSVGSRDVGGLGLVLIARMSRDVRYARTDGRNRIWVAMAAGEAAR